ncbi:MAG TPA: FmdB family zinc ribbon protein [Thermoanaerobaculia bacterium]|nr:FmdB family zinc ribbon protein [Thermoanaerobaculia bacterium]
MPTYEYRCVNGHHFEQFQRMSEAPVAVCPECGAAVERLLSSGAGLLFKGSGFYITDYRSDSYRKAAAKDSGGGPKAGDGSEKSSSDGSEKSSSGGSEKSSSGGSEKSSSGEPPKTGGAKASPDKE